MKVKLRGAGMLLASVLVFSLTAAKGSEPGQGVRVERSEYGVYIVLMDLAPLIAYEGGESGYQATRPAKGRKLNPNSPDVRRYRQHLRASHDASLTSAGVRLAAKLHDYTVALNGYAAALSYEQVLAISAQDGVRSVRADRMRYKTTDNTPGFLGLTDPAGAWAKQFTGENVVVGVIDTGIWPEHPSFADDGSYAPLPGYTSLPCEFGNTAHNPNDAPFSCNQKLLGAREMLTTYRSVFGVEPAEFDSARDDDGHGTHTAATAAGNSDVYANIFGIPRSAVSGIANRARVIAYKGLGPVGGFASDLAAAIDQAVADGVDVINYSVGGAASLAGADEIAFLSAADAGVFVATSAGNSGPGPGTVGGPATVPWITSVGASTQSRAFISEVTLSGPGSPPGGLWGGSVTPGIEDYLLVDAEGIPDVGGDTSGKCLNEFPTGTFQSNEAVLCNQYDFGVARTQRVRYVANAGGGAVVFHNSPAVTETPTDNHPLPTVHMLNAVGQPLKDYLVANPGQVHISFTEGVARYAGDDPRVVPDVMASFSSRGPNPVALDILKPDITAPGVSILAGASPIHLGSAAQGQLFQAIMGTSMSSPHVAGVFALIKQAHPDWSPAMARSALMTTAHQDVVKHDGETPADPFDVGAGHIVPGGMAIKGSAYQPGLAYDAGFFEYLGFLCDAAPETFADPASTCGYLDAIGIPTEARNLNLPSIGIAELAGSGVITRTVTSVAADKGWRSYDVSVDAPPGYQVAVSPPALRLRSGDSASYRVTFTSDGSAPIGEWRFGSLSWHDKSGHYDVRSPIAVRGSLFHAPGEITGSGAEGSASFDVRFGYTGSYTAAAHGLVKPVVSSDTVAQDPDQSFDPNDGYSQLHQLNLSGALHLKIALPPEAAEPGADLDLYVYGPGGVFVASSTHDGTNEQVDIPLPADGIWSVYVHGWSTPGGDSNYDLRTWAVPSASGGSLSIDAAPSSAVLGASGTIDVSWSGLDPDWYLGGVSHTGDAGLMGLTLVDVDNR